MAGTPQLTPLQVAAFRLSRHHLSGRAPAAALAETVRRMAGAQAQVLSAAQIALWARVEDLRIDDVDAALRKRILVRAWCMRRTLHLLPAADLSIFVRGSARRAEREIRWMHGQGISSRTLDRVIDAALTAMDEPITRRELAERISRSLRVRMRAYTGGGWGNRSRIPAVAVGRLTVPIVYLLHLVGARGVICSGPARGGEPTFVRADAWIPRWRDVPRDRAERELLGRYLRAFAPATPEDFASWVGMPLAGAREIWAAESSTIAPVTVGGWNAAVLRDDLPHLQAAAIDPPSIRLLPYFDSFLLGHKTRDHLVAERHLKQVYRAQGWIAPVLLIDGRAAGVWTHVREKGRLTVRVTTFAPVSRRVAATIGEEGQDLARFFGAPRIEVQII